MSAPNLITCSSNEALMKRAVKWSVILGTLGLIGWIAFGPLWTRWKEHSRVNYREAETTRGKVVVVVNATGTIKPVRSVTVGTFVSGPIKSILVDFNAEVKKDTLLATIDQRIYRATWLAIKPRWRPK